VLAGLQVHLQRWQAPACTGVVDEPLQALDHLGGGLSVRLLRRQRDEQQRGAEREHERTEGLAGL
jgi:hypothetical protein